MAEDDRNGTRLADRVAGILGRLQKEADSRVGKRQPIEQRWLEDLRQYHGLYDPAIEKDLSDANRSKLFINQTRRKTDAISARISDLLFPTDDKNWGIQPTPVPRLTEEANAAVAQARQKAEQAVQAEMAAQQPDAPPEAQDQAQAAREDANRAEEAAKVLQAQIEEGKRRADLMSQEIDDQLKESNYHAVMRDLIEDGCKLGTGVCKGPVTGDRVRKGWKRQPVMAPMLDVNGQPVMNADGQPQMSPRVDEGGQPVLSDEYTLINGEAERSPAMRWVDIWSFFPDMDAKNVQDGQGVFERHLLNPKQLRALARLPGFDADAIRRLLKDKARSGAPSYLADLRNISKDSNQPTTDLYHVWEYSGPIDGEDLRDLADLMGDDTMMEDAGDPDPLDEVHAVIWFCQGELLKLSIYPLDSYECMYSVYNLVRDESTVFGYGIPYLIRDPQRSLNSAWRAMMDNGGRSAGPMIYIDKQYVEPENGIWSIEPWKVWLGNGELPPQRRAFEVIEIPNRQPEQANIIGLSKQFIEEMAEMPPIAQGEQGVNRQTFGGQALQMNSANVVFRRFVRNFDDDVTTPNIRRFYDYNMQFSQKAEIKGDFDVDARGSSVLLVRELQAQNLMWIAANLGAHPVFGPMLKNRALLRKTFQTMMVPSDEVVLTDEEIDAVLARAAAQEGAQQQVQAADQARAEEMQMKAALSEMEWNYKMEIARMERETAMIGYATKANVELDKLEAMLADKAEDRASKERLAAAEAAMTAAVGPGGGGYF